MNTTYTSNTMQWLAEVRSCAAQLAGLDEYGESAAAVREALVASLENLGGSPELARRRARRIEWYARADARWHR